MKEEQTAEQMEQIVKNAPKEVQEVFQRLDELDCNGDLGYKELKVASDKLKELGYRIEYDLGCYIYEIVKI